MRARLKETLEELRSLGTRQNRKIYQQHGSGPDVFGVSIANLRKLRKRIKTDHALARELWASGVTDARVLATLIADPKAATIAELDRWARDLDCYMVTDALVNNLACRSPRRRRLAEKWSRARAEFVSAAGWQLHAHLAMSDDELKDAHFRALLKTIEEQIADAPNRTRHAMNGALIAIGLRSDALERRALAAADRIGKVEVDHGQTSSTTPDAASYIAKRRQMLLRRRQRARS